MPDGPAAPELGSHEPDATALAQAALAAMGRHGVPPNPRNYLLWYSYCGGRCPALSQAIDQAIAAGQAFTPLFSEELYLRFLAAQPDAERLDRATEQLQGSLDRVLGSIDQSRSATGRYGRALDAWSGQLADNAGREPQQLIARLIEETRQMSEHTRALESQLVRSQDEVRELRQNLVTLEQDALTDALTGIPNRKAFEARLHHAATESMESGESLSLLMVDIDHFKQFNDTHGHLTGDRVLRLVAQALSESVKGRDAACRYGGEEFAIVLPHTPLAGAVAVAEDIRERVMRRHIIRRSQGELLGTLTLSAGASTYRLGEALSELVQRADAALYLAKRSGRNCVRDENALGQPAAATT